ncbi:hypothetical protein [Amycolatopsis sp. lyj-23]|uniref:hypothetical protein n=1 Tax=Amycolatopsis sp. lyj-23 TaxID=2789283 RepID=UPI0039784693
MTTADLHTLTGAYAINALSDLERAASERHLDQCEDCRLEVRELKATAAHLAVDLWLEPSSRLRSAVLTAVTHTRQLPPRVSDQRILRRMDRESRGSSRRPPWS